MDKWIYLLFASLIVACSNNTYTPPMDDPNGSWWVGGEHGGVYVFIEDDKNTQDKIYQGTIYYEFDQSVWYKGKFEFNGTGSLDYKNKSLYNGWDGEKLFLKDNTYLQALNPLD